MFLVGIKCLIIILCNSWYNKVVAVVVAAVVVAAAVIVVAMHLLLRVLKPDRRLKNSNNLTVTQTWDEKWSAAKKWQKHTKQNVLYFLLLPSLFMIIFVRNVLLSWTQNVFFPSKNYWCGK